MFLVQLYACFCMCIHLWVCVCLCMHVCRGWRLTLGAIYQSHLSWVFWDSVSRWDLELPSYARFTGQWTSGTFYLHLSSTGITSVCHQTWTFTLLLGIKPISSGLYGRWFTGQTIGSISDLKKNNPFVTSWNIKMFRKVDMSHSFVPIFTGLQYQVWLPSCEVSLIVN